MNYIKFSKLEQYILVGLVRKAIAEINKEYRITEDEDEHKQITSDNLLLESIYDKLNKES